MLEPTDVLLLAEDEQDQLLELIGKIEQRKSEVIDVKPSEFSAGRPDGN